MPDAFMIDHIMHEGTHVDLILVTGNPLKNLDLLAEPDKVIVVIMKDGVIYNPTSSH